MFCSDGWPKLQNNKNDDSLDSFKIQNDFLGKVTKPLIWTCDDLLSRINLSKYRRKCQEFT